MDKLKSIAVPVTRRSIAGKPRKASQTQAAPTDRMAEAPRRHAATEADAPQHRYGVGQRLKLLGSGRYWARSAGLCQVVALLPHEGGPLLYRVRSEAESFERVVPEADLVTPEG